MGDMSDWVNQENPDDYDGGELVEVPYIRILKETEKAFLFLFDDSNIFNQKKEWIPKSQIADLNDGSETIEIPEWLAAEKSLV